MALKPGEKIAALRNAKGWTEVQLADLVGVNDGTISRWESGKFNPDRVTFEHLADVLDVHPGYLTERGVTDLDELQPVEVAIRESFRFFLEELPLAVRRRAERYRSGFDIPIAPRTREGWHQLHSFIEAARLGRPD